MNSTASIEELTVAKYLCQSSSLDFTRYFFKKRFGRKFIVGDHHKAISDVLDKVINGEIKRLIINIAPRYGKTELAVKNFIAHGLAVNPAAKFIHLSYSDDLALDNSEEVRDIVTSQEYQQLFPLVKIKPKSEAKKKWYTTAGGGVYATSAAGQVTGFGAGTVEEEVDFDFLDNEKNTHEFGGALIIDDPIKPDDADSDTIRNRINNRWDSTIKNRVNSRNTPIIIIMQRLHEDDLCGYITKQSPGDWHVLSLPSIKADGTALWPFKHTIEELEKLRKENEVVFERQHMQDPKESKGLLFPLAELKRFSLKELKIADCESKLGYIDVADEGIDNLSFPSAHIMPNKVFITDVIFTQDGVEVTIPLCAAMIKKINHDYVRIETNNQGKQFKTSLEDLVPGEKLLGVKNTTNKLTRILMQSGFIKEYFYFRNDYLPGSDYDKFMKQVTAFLKNGKSTLDDAPDSLAGLAKMIRGFVDHMFKNAVKETEEK